MPKTVAKKTNVPKADKKVSTQDKNKMIISNETSAKEEKNKSKNKTETNIKEQSTSTKKEKSKLEELKNKNLEYEKKLTAQEEKYKEEKKKTLEELSQYNSIIEDKNNEITKLTKNNKKKFEQLNDIKNEVDEKMKLIKIFKLLELELENLEKAHRNKIKIIEKEKIIEKRNLEYEQKKLKKQKEINNKYENIDIDSLKTTLKELNDKIAEIKENTKELKQIDKIHKFCSKNQKKDEMELNLLKNEKEFQIKKQNNLENQLNRDEDNSIYMEDEEMENSIRKKYKKNFASNRRLSPNNSMNIYKTAVLYDKEKAKKKMIQMKKYENLRLSLENDLNKINKKNHLESKNLKKFQSKDSLFLTNEKNILKKYFPLEALKNFQNRYDIIQTEKKEIEKFIEENKEMKNIINGNKEKIEYSDLKKRESNEKTIKFKSIIINQKKLIKGFHDEIKKINSELNYHNQIFNVKTEENSRLNKQFNEDIENIKKGKLKLKEGEEKPDFIDFSVDESEGKLNEEESNGENNNNEQTENEEENNDENNYNDNVDYQENEENED
jgi:hypothetical protein